MAYPIPPWLQGNSPEGLAQLWLHGATAGANISAEKERLAASEVASERNAIRDQQQMEMDKARQQAELGMRKRTLDQSEKSLQLQMQTAARRFQANQKYQTMVSRGMDPVKALLTVGPEFGQSMTGFAALAKASMPQPALPPPSVEKFGDEDFLKVPTRTGAQYHPLRPEGGLSRKETARLTVLQNQRRDLLKDPIKGMLITMPPAASENLRTKQEAAKKELSAIDEELNRIAPPVGATGGGAKKRWTFNQETGDLTEAPEPNE